MSNRNICLVRALLTLFRIGLFGLLTDGRGGNKKTSLPKMMETLISYNDESLDGYTLPKEDPKNI